MNKMTNSIFPVGIIDIGSNSVRLMFADGVFIDKYLITTRLGGGLDVDGRLSLSSIMTTANAVFSLKEKALSLGAKTVMAFATAAVRSAVNRQEFVSVVKRVSGLDVEIIAGEVEAELGLLGALPNCDGGIIDVGGASTEIAVKKLGCSVSKHSYSVGAVYLNKLYAQNKNQIENFLNDALKKQFECEFKTLKIIGGTATSLGAIALNLKKYDPKLVDGYYISVTDLVALVDKLFLMTPLEISKNYAIDTKRADVIAGGGAILCKIALLYGLEGLVVSESDNLEGYLRYKGFKGCLGVRR